MSLKEINIEALLEGTRLVVERAVQWQAGTYLLLLDLESTTEDQATKQRLHKARSEVLITFQALQAERQVLGLPGATTNELRAMQ